MVPGLELAKVTAPRRLQSFAAAVQADAAAVSSVRSTVIETSAALRAIGAGAFETALPELLALTFIL